MKLSKRIQQLLSRLPFGMGNNRPHVLNVHQEAALANLEGREVRGGTQVTDLHEQCHKKYYHPAQQQ